MPTDVLQTELTSCMNEVQQIEAEIDAQLKELGEKVDEGFMQMSQLNKQITSVATSVLKNTRWEKGVAVASAAINAVAGAWESVKHAKAHNEALDKLMVTKRQIARARLDSIERLGKVTAHVVERLEKLVDNEAERTLDIDAMTMQLWLAQEAVMMKTMSLYRASLYSKMLVDYLHAEYKAWLQGKQKSSLGRPTYYDCNLAIAEHLCKGETPEERMHQLASPDETTMSGTDVYLINDPQILSVMLIAYGLTGEGNQITPLTVTNETPAGQELAATELYQSYKKSAGRMETAAFFSPGMITFLMLVAGLGLDWLLFHWLDWAGWIEWTLGIILGFVICIIVGALHEGVSSMHAQWVEDIYTDELNKQLEASGYVEIYEPDLEKKNVAWEGVKGTVTGLLSAFLD